MKKPEFPKEIKVGQTRATIYKINNRGRTLYTTVWYVGTERKRKIFKDLDAAIFEANAQVNSLSRGEAKILQLSGEELLSFTRAREIVSEFGLSLDSVAAEYRDAKRLARGASLVEAAQCYADTRLHDIPRKTVTEVYREMLKAKKDEGLSERYLQDLESRVGKFANDFQVQIASVTGPEIKAWLQGMEKCTAKGEKAKGAPKVSVSNRTRNNFRLGIQTLYSFAKAQKYLPPDWNGLDAVPLWKVKEEAVEIFTPEEMSTLLALAGANLIPFLAIGAFAGLRSAELERLDWSKVNLETGYITVDASIAKTNSRRLVPILPNLKAWLKPHAKERGPVVELANVVNAIRRLVDSTRPADPRDPGKLLAPTVPWRHNALRHSFCSYRLADIKTAAQVALEAGNSPQMIFQHYRELVTAEEAAKWFAVTPESVKEIQKNHAKQKAEAQAAAAKKVIKLEQMAA